MIRVLGPLQVHGEQPGPVDMGSPRHREVLAALVVDAGRVVSTDTLLARVWGEGARGATTANLHAVISRLRGRLGAVTGVEIATAPPGYRLVVPAGGVDADVFQDAFSEARGARASGDLPRARALVGEALDLWHGTAYADIHQSFAEAEAARLDGQRLAAHELAAELDLAMGLEAQVAERLAPLVEEHPLRENFWGQLMLALFRVGRQADALAAYARVRDLLSTELGLDPGPDLQQLHQRILEQDPTLLRPAKAPPATPAAVPAQVSPAPAAAAGDMVAPPGGLVGREREVEYVRALLEESAERLVTLTGVGGVGKTRLALAVADAARSSYADGVVTVALAPLADHTAVVPAVGRAVGLAHVEGADPLAALVEHLRPLRTLLVLDNAEHVVDAGPQLSTLVAACPGLTLLVTSRSVLRVRGETQFQVLPLPLPERSAEDPATVGQSDAVRLFVARARSSAPTFALEPANAGAVAAICRRLAGIPLAIELAAARTRMLPPAAILQRLDEVMAAAGARDLPPRQRTMRATIDWSHDLLEPDEQRAFRWLSVFAGGFTLEAAEAVVPVPGMLTVLEALVEQSLVISDPDPSGSPRFRMLEPVSQYAEGTLAEEEAVAARDAHAAYFLGLAEELEPAYAGAGATEALARTDREHANLVAALEWTIAGGRADLAGRFGWALWLFWWLRGDLIEGRRLMEAVLDLDPPEDVRVTATTVCSALAFAQGDLAAARRWSEGAQLARRIGDKVGEARCVGGVGLVALAEGDLATAEEALQAALRLTEETGDVGGWLWTLVHVWLGTVSLLRGDTDHAASWLTHALAAARARGDRLAIYVGLFTAVQVDLVRGDLDRARQQVEEGIRLSEETRDLANLAYFLDALLVVDASAGRTDRVGVLRGAALQLRETVGADVYGYYQPDEERLAAALDAAEEAEGTAYAEGLARGRALSLAGMVSFALGQEPQAPDMPITSDTQKDSRP